MIRNGFPMVYLESICHFLNSKIQKVSFPNTNQNNVQINECGRMCHRISLDRLGVRPLGEVLGDDHNISHVF
jgi:hypothetical protein